MQVLNQQIRDRVRESASNTLPARPVLLVYGLHSEKHDPMDLPAVMEMLYLCPVQYGIH